MDKEIVILLIGTLIIGLAGGFILNFIAYQPQIQSLRNDLASLEDEIDSRFAESEESLSELNEAFSNMSSAIDNLNRTSETEPENETATTYEQMNVQAQAASNGTHFEITFGIVNSGTANATLVALYLYQYPIHVIPDVTSLVLNGMLFPDKTFTLFIPVGSAMGGTVTLIEGSEEGFNFQSGAVLEFRFLSAQGYSYPVLVHLP
jgi:uncharacterized membrane-anchored protein YhcB (DUF1043 family)